MIFLTSKIRRIKTEERKMKTTKTKIARWLFVLEEMIEARVRAVDNTENENMINMINDEIDLLLNIRASIQEYLTFEV